MNFWKRRRGQAKRGTKRASAEALKGYVTGHPTKESEKPMTTKDRFRPGAVDCPTCKASAGRPCTTNGELRFGYCTARTELAAEKSRQDRVEREGVVHLRIMGGPPIPGNECGIPGGDGTEDDNAITCVECLKIVRGEPPYINRNTPIDVAEDDARVMHAFGLGCLGSAKTWLADEQAKLGPVPRHSPKAAPVEMPNGMALVQRGPPEDATDDERADALDASRAIFPLPAGAGDIVQLPAVIVGEVCALTPTVAAVVLFGQRGERFFELPRSQVGSLRIGDRFELQIVRSRAADQAPTAVPTRPATGNANDPPVCSEHGHVETTLRRDCIGCLARIFGGHRLFFDPTARAEMLAAVNKTPRPANPHEGHGSGTREHGPDEWSCPCTENRLACARAGCGFCAQLTPTTPTNLARAEAWVSNNGVDFCLAHSLAEEFAAVRVETRR